VSMTQPAATAQQMLGVLYMRLRPVTALRMTAYAVLCGATLLLSPGGRCTFAMCTMHAAPVAAFGAALLLLPVVSS
jgi:hypothetical protein